ncbi:MAG TPA: ferritin-like domain-containing protein [Armatimonadota bacterium]|nr:ferritin-like domain-containing protein [Armatimonadota bacterium]
MAGEQGNTNFAHGQDVLTLLNRDLANEMNTMLMYMAGSLLVRGQDAFDVKEVASKFSKQDFKHAKKIAARIVELEGSPQLMPTQIDNNASIDAKMPSQRATGPQALLKDALECELQSVVEYRNQIQNIEFNDPATCLLLQGILADKEHQAEEIRDLLGV